MALKKSDIEKFKKRLEEMRSQMTHIIRESTEDVKSVEGLKKLINDTFIEKVRVRFNEMFMQMKEAQV